MMYLGRNFVSQEKLINLENKYFVENRLNSMLFLKLHEQFCFYFWIWIFSGIFNTDYKQILYI